MNKMPHALELEEFGLEVEREHHALIGSSDDDAAAATDGAISSSATHRRMQHVALSTPSKEQRSLLQSINVRPPRLLRPGMFKWATLLIALAFVVFLNLGQESEEAIYFEEALPEVDVCEDDDIAFTNMFKSESNCATFVTSSSKNDMAKRCDKPIGIPDENEFQKLLKHFCRKSCGLCGTTEDDQLLQEEIDDANIQATVLEIADEIEEKELETKIKVEKEEQAREKQIMKQIKEDMETEETKPTQISIPANKPIKSDDTVEEKEVVAPNTLITNITMSEDHPTELPCQDEFDSKTSIDKSYCDNLLTLSSTLRSESCNSPIDELDEESESKQKLIKHVCRMSCGLCDDAIDNNGVDSVVQENVKQSNASELENIAHGESDSEQAEESSESNLQAADSVVDDEVDQSNDDETVTAAEEEVSQDDDDGGDEDDDDGGGESNSGASGNEIRKEDDGTIR